MFKSFFAHHPNCDQYDHHVLQISEWRFCLGCTAMYFGILITFVLDFLIISPRLTISNMIRIGLFLLFFIPAMIQLFWKSNIRVVKFSMRFCLGISIWMYLSVIFRINVIWIKILLVTLLVVGILTYSRFSSELVECESCDYDQEFETCLIKHEDILDIENLEMIEEEIDVVRKILHLKEIKDRDELVELNLIDD